MKVLNAFSLNMLNASFRATVEVEPTSAEFASGYLEASGGAESYIGHPDTARIVGEQLGFELPPNRATVKLENHETAVVAQYTGPRLPAGATELPEGAQIHYFLVTVHYKF